MSAVASLPASYVWATDEGFLQFGFWYQRPHVQRLMRAGVGILAEPVIDDTLRLLRCREPLRIENLLAQRAIEPFVASVLPCTARQGIAWRCPERSDPR